jgi:hypothetical protein
VVPDPQDVALRRHVLATEVLPRWLERCGAACATEWNIRLAPVVGSRAGPN